MMELLPLLKLCGTFAVLMMCLRFKLPLGPAFLISAALLGLAFGLAPIAALATLAAAVIEAKTIALAAVVCLILLFSDGLQQSGRLTDVMAGLEGIMGQKRIGLVLFPALIGLLPMPGGAIFSAPMVDAAADGEGWTPERKVMANYWFRHIWEYIWPLYPGIILTAALSHVPVFTVSLWQLWFTPVMAATGLLLVFGRRWPRLSIAQVNRHEARRLWRGLRPIISLIALALAFTLLFSKIITPAHPRLTELEGELPLLVALILITLIPLVTRSNKISRGKVNWKRLVEMSVMIVGIMAFKDALTASGAVPQLSEAFRSLGLPLGVIITVVPFIAGAVTGIAVGFAGAALPVILPMITSPGSISPDMRYLTLAFVAGFLGVLVSPTHLCLVLTREYFRAGFAKTYRFLLPGVTMMAVAAGLYFLAAGWLANV